MELEFLTEGISNAECEIAVYLVIKQLFFCY